jgi:heptosyltransferase II
MTKKILIIAPSWVGDMVMAQSLLRLLKQRDPFVALDVLASVHLHPLLLHMPEINRILELPFNHGEFNLKGRYSIGKKLRSERYDQAIVLPNSWKSALIPFFARIPRRTGWRGEFRYILLNDIRVLDKEKFPLMVQRFLALGSSLDNGQRKYGKEKVICRCPLSRLDPFLPSLAVSAENVLQTLHKFNLAKPSCSIIACCVGAEYGASKRWPTNYFAEVAKVKANEGYAIWLLGGNKDREAAASIQKASGNVCTDFTGRTDLSEVVDLLSLASAVVTNDTGLMHIAAALNLPLIVIYGSSSPEFTPPLTKDAKILALGLTCSPCFKRVCPLRHFKCMLDLKPDFVLKALKGLKK